ncbi:MAG: T9SS type A sorting domain-containing protein [Xanthomarina gelatinilytica]|uniref:T9SS type A sorting domain-containing protein n=1 Tax=Xanthomarina gelatinilytica TaxID=1137281 RepID=UPI003A865CE2
MKQFLLFLTTLLPLTFFGQTQIGNELEGIEYGEGFGSSVSFSDNGNILAVGARFYGNSSNFNDAGIVRVYENINGTWIQLGNDIEGSTSRDLFGSSVSLSANGTILAIGAPHSGSNVNIHAGYARIYQFQNNSWQQLGSDINGTHLYEKFGQSISLSSDGTTVAIGAPESEEISYQGGQVKVFRFNTTNLDWEQLGGNLNPQSPTSTIGGSSKFGTSVSLSSDGNTLAIGAPYYIQKSSTTGNTEFSGKVSIYRYNNGGWSLLGVSILGSPIDSGLGKSVSLSSDGTIVAIGANGFSGSNGNYIGRISVYELSGGSWDLKGNHIEGEVAYDNFGFSVVLSDDGSIVASCSPSNNSASGRVRLYQFYGNSWNQVGNNIDGEAASDQAGTAIALSSDGSILAVGASGHDVFNPTYGDNTGHVKVYGFETLTTSNTKIVETYGLYPNPATNQVTISLPQNLNLKYAAIYNALGQKTQTTTNTTINTSAFAKGIYYIEVVTNQGKATKKLIKQ